MQNPEIRDLIQGIMRVNELCRQRALEHMREPNTSDESQRYYQGVAEGYENANKTTASLAEKHLK